VNTFSLNLFPSHKVYLKCALFFQLSKNINSLTEDLAEERGRRAEMGEREKSLSEIKANIKALEEDLRKMYVKHTEIASENCRYQEELKTLTAAKMECSEALLMKENKLIVKTEKLENLRCDVKEAHKVRFFFLLRE